MNEETKQEFIRLAMSEKEEDQKKAHEIKDVWESVIGQKVTLRENGVVIWPR